MKGIIAWCYVFSRRGWIRIFLCASDWTPNPTNLNYVGNLRASVTTKSRIKLVSFTAVFKAQQISRIGPFSSLCTAFCYVGFLYKLHMMRPKKSRFTTSQPRIKLFWKHGENFFKLSPCWPLNIVVLAIAHSRVNY